MPSTLEIVVACVTRWHCSRDAVAYSSDTDLMALPSSDPEWIEDVVGELQDTFILQWPHIAGKKGELRAAQLFLPERLTIGELCQIVDSKEWPMAWTLPGFVLND